MILGSHQRASRFVGMLVLAMGLLVSLAACGSTPSRSGASATTSTTTPKASTTKPTTDAPTNISFGTGSVGPADPTTTVPNERGRTIAPDFEAGQNVIITSTGFEPSTLEANVAAPVVWTNLSGRPQRIIFINFAVDSGTVPPGGTFTWSTTNAVDISYLSDTTGWHGTLQMNPNSP
jgi:hypothetical protein